jgi:glycosyltransferase involved in cell wall biosynthesis
VLLSIVSATRNSAVEIAQCLDALCPQAQAAGAQVIVADSSDDGSEKIVLERFPAVTVLHFSNPLTIPELRGTGIAASCGRIIAIIDAFSIVDASWVAAVLKAHRERPNLVIGGVVDLHQAASQNLRTWSVYINEYGRFMPPREEGEVGILPASNISYKREALFDASGPKYEVFWKEFVNQQLEAAGHGLWLDPAIAVSMRKPISIGDFFLTRYDHGRCFAGMRAERLTHGRRVIHAITFPLLPFLFLWRCGSNYWITRRFRSKFVLTLPLQFLLFSSWSVGEFVGYLHGPGDSCRVHYY